MELHVNGVKLYYRVSGHGPAVILVHGNGEDHSIFDETAALLSCDYTVYALDSRGHGKSSVVETLGYQNMADDVASFIRKLDIRKPVFCGFSDGAIIGMLVAEQNPGLLSKLILCGGNAYPQGIMVSAVPPDQPFRQGSEDPDDVGGAADHRGRVKTDCRAGAYSGRRERYDQGRAYPLSGFEDTGQSTRHSSGGKPRQLCGAQQKTVPSYKEVSCREVPGRSDGKKWTGRSCTC